ncbi:MAG: hypothetical protein ACK40T_10585, partial [Akkermansiaceae bacterium]
TKRSVRVHFAASQISAPKAWLSTTAKSPIAVDETVPALAKTTRPNPVRAAAENFPENQNPSRLSKNEFSE